MNCRFPIALTVLAGLALPLAPGCLDPLNALGSPTLEGDLETQGKEQKTDDDRIEDKVPVYDEGRWTVETFHADETTCEVRVNKSAAVTRLDIVGFGEEDGSLATALFPTRAEAIAAAQGASGAELIPSMEVVNGQMKPFNDGLYAALEVAIQEGQSGVPFGKKAFLTDLLAALNVALGAATATQRPALEDAAVFVGAALLLANETAALPPALLTRAQAEAATFRTNTLSSRPLGFYTWNPTLEAVFRQDRFLQNRDDLDPQRSFARFVALAAVLESDPGLKERYAQLLVLSGGLTNRFASYTPADLFPLVEGLGSLDDGSVTWAGFTADHPRPFPCSGSWFALVPAAQSKDSDYLSTVFCDGIPETTQPLDVLIDGIRSGKLDLAPSPGAGWYEYQLYALETLLLPERGAESQNLLLMSAYKKKLIETFKSLITQVRETHVKGLIGFGADRGVPPTIVDLYPKFPVEPFPTFYLRNARAYRFLETFLSGTVAAGALTAGHRLYEDHASTLPLGQELRDQTRLLYGLYVLSSQSVGSKVDLLPDELLEYPLAECLAAAQSWVAGWTTSPDVLADPRVIAPLGQSRTHVFYSAVIGVKTYRASAEFVPGHEPKLEFVDNCALGQFLRHDYYLLSEDTVQVALGADAAPPTRAELRALCDQHRTRAAIVQALEAL